MPLRHEHLPLGRRQGCTAFFQRQFCGLWLTGCILNQEQCHPAFRPLRFCIHRILQHRAGPFDLAGASEQLSEPDEIAGRIFLVACEAPFGLRHGTVELARL